MPVSITKATVSEEMITKMVQKAFGCEPKEITELTEGFYNVAYRIALGDRTVILKVAPSPEVEILTSEKNIMWAEVDSMRMAKAKSLLIARISLWKLWRGKISLLLWKQCQRKKRQLSSGWRGNTRRS